jgi:hypothetical protein
MQDPQEILEALSQYALDLCKAESAGLSLLEQDDKGREIFRWVATTGIMRKHEGGTTPRNFSPCGVCLERNAPQLFSYPEHYYSYLQAVGPIAEALLIPFYGQSDWLGTVWVLCHHERRKFDREDARIMTSLAGVAAAAFRTERMADAPEKKQNSDELTQQSLRDFS